jgi:hypothetical protein
MNRFAFSLMVATVAALPYWFVACGGLPAGAGGAGGAQNTTDTPQEECPATIEEPCMRYHIPLDGNPSTDVALRSKYIAAFGDACYMSEVDTFGCFYKKPKAACTDAVNMAEVYGAAPFDKGYMCQPIPGTDDYSLQVGPDVANNIMIDYQAAPRQTPLTEVDGAPAEVNGPYRTLTDPADVGPGNEFASNSGMPDGTGGFLIQKKWVLQVNRKGHNDGKIHSDLAGFTWPCKGQDGSLTMCTELDVLEDPDTDAGSPFYADTVAQVHHVVPMIDKRCCPWGTNSYKNAAVISGKLNRYFTNNDPPADEVKRLNKAVPYTP